MRKPLFILSFSIMAIFIMTGSVLALSLVDLGTEITINDGLPNSTWGGGSDALGIAGEDNETEGNPNTYTYQRWDLEGMFWNETTNKLFIIGGFDYLDGAAGYPNIPIGDLFIGTDYVLDLSRGGGSNGEHLKDTDGRFDLIKNYTETEGAHDILASSPYRYVDGGSIVANGSYSAYQISEADWNGIDLFEPWRESYNGDWNNDVHYALEIFSSESDFGGGIFAGLISAGNQIHLTFQCGNDDIEGQVPVPEPSTMFLFGTGLIFLAGIGRKKFVLTHSHSIVLGGFEEIS